MSQLAQPVATESATRPPTTVPAASRAARPRSWEASQFGIPTRTDEAWRFTPLREIQEHFTAAAAAPIIEVTTPDRVTHRVIDQASAAKLKLPEPGELTAALAARGQVDHIQVPEDEQSAPVWVKVSGTGRRVDHHLVLTVGERAQVTVVIDQVESGQLNELLSLVAGPESQVTIVSLTRWDDRAHRLVEHNVAIGAQARVRHITVSLGGQLLRMNVNASYRGPGGSFEGLGVYLAGPGQHLEHRLFVDHGAPDCASSVEYKGALHGKAHTVWVGDVLIGTDATGTDTYEINRNLLLTDGARADSVPNLEIETGQIARAGHASTTGRFDDEHLFYLMSRGISPEQARRLVVQGFFASVVARIELPELVADLMQRIDQELEEVS